MLRASLGVRFAVFSGLVVEQARGLPIGGPLSDFGAPLLLSMQKAAWASRAPLREASAWACLPRPEDCDADVGQVRYMDDMLTLRRTLCEGFVGHYVQ